MGAAAKPKVIVFVDHLLYPSETFIRAPAMAFTEFEPVFAGSRRVAGQDLPEERTYTISKGDLAGRAHEAAFKLFGVAPRLTRQLGPLNPVLLHAHYGANGLRALPLARRLGIPLIVTFHGSDATATDLSHEKTHFGHRRYIARKAELLDGAALFLTDSQFIRRKLLEQGFPEAKVEVQYTGVDTKMFRPAPAEQGPLILFVGRLVERKGPDFMIRAAAQIQNEFPATEVVLIGDGPMRAQLEKQAKDSLRRYQFLGMRTHREVSEWMNRASVFCAPSVRMPSGEEEAFGMVYAEAMAMEKPVVAFDSGGISEVVSHGNTGFLAQERDWRTLADHLSILLKNAELRRTFGVAGRERVLSEFNLEHWARVLESRYAKISGRQFSAPEVVGLTRATGIVSAS